MAKRKRSKLEKLLDSSIDWPMELEPDTLYERLQDDHDGTFEGKVQVFFNSVGDGYIFTGYQMSSLRFRTLGGGGKSLRVRNALLILALAIKLDNDDEKKRNEKWLRISSALKKL